MNKYQEAIAERMTQKLIEEEKAYPSQREVIKAIILSQINNTERFTGTWEQDIVEENPNDLVRWIENESKKV